MKKKNRLKFLMAIGLLMTTLIAFAQQKVISGKVTDTSGEPLPGVTVFFTGTTNGTITDIDGKFSLNIPEGKTMLTYSFIGMQTQKVDISGKTVADVVLKKESIGLEEVVAVGYGVQKKSDLTGSVVSYKKDELVKTPMARVDQAMQGKISGVSISNDKGQPGAAPVIRIRGDNSIAGNNAPLIVIDGILGGDLSTLSPNEIESMEVLKDASATAIYGSRGANGVIIVTTKGGEAGKTKFNFSSYWSVSQTANRLDLMNADEQVTLLKDYPSSSSLYPEIQELLALHEKGRSTDWQDEVFQNAPVQSYSLNVTGGSEKTKFALSGSLFKQDGIIKKTGYERQTLRFKLNNKVNDKINLGVNMYLSKSVQNNTRVDTPGGSAGGSVTQAANRYSPILPVYNELGEYSEVIPRSVQLNNPVALINERKDDKKAFSTTANAFVDYEIVKDLKLKSTYTYRFSNSKYQFWAGKELLEASGIGEGRIRSYNTNYWLNENTLTFDRTYAGKHHVTLMGGLTASEQSTGGVVAQGIDFATTALKEYALELANPNGGQSINSSYNDFTMLSYLARANYVLDGKYLFTFNYRADGSSKFAKNHKWGHFPSAALGWRMSEEAFMEALPQVSNLKARLSYGVVGSQAIRTYQSLSTYRNVTVPLGTNFFNGNILDQIANDNLKWETTEQINFGIDLGLFNNRVSLIADYYKKTTKDLLFQASMPYYTGSESRTENIGSIENKGFEFALSTVNIDKEFKWTSNFNISFNKNKVLDLGDDQYIVYNASGGSLPGFDETAILKVGESLGSFFGYIFDGIYQTPEECAALPYPSANDCEPGMIKLKDIAGAKDANGNDMPDGKIDANDRTIIGNGLPDFTYGFSNDFSYKGFDLNIMFQGSYGNDIFNFNRVKLEKASYENGLASLLTDSWNGPGTSNEIQSLDKSVGPASSRFVEDGSYLRLKNVSLGYTLPNVFTKKFGVENLRFYVSAQNLLTITDYSGYDPEINSRGYDPDDNSGVGNVMRGFDYGGYPTSRTYTFGLNMNF